MKSMKSIDMIISLLEAKNKRIEELEYALRLMVYQYCVAYDGEDPVSLDHQFMCAGEQAFLALGYHQGDPVAQLERELFGDG